MKNIKELPFQFTGIGEVKEIEFIQITGGEFAYIYKVFNGNPYFEVFERKNSPVCIDFTKRIYSETEFKETYPKSKSFGVWAWTFSNIEDAFEKYNQINKPKS